MRRISQPANGGNLRPDKRRDLLLRWRIPHDGGEIGFLPLWIGRQIPALQMNFEAVAVERKRVHRVDAVTERLHNNIGIVADMLGHIDEGGFAPLPLRRQVEVKRERVEELQQFVVIKQFGFFDPRCRLFIGGKNFFEPLLKKCARAYTSSLWLK